MDKCTAVKLLKNASLKVTRQRELLLDTIINREGVFSVDALYREMSDSMDLVTVYRILGIFAGCGIVREVTVCDNTHLYELSCVHNPLHPHFICRVCNSIICLEEPEPKLLNELASQYSLQIEEIRILFTGVCSKCK